MFPAFHDPSLEHRMCSKRVLYESRLLISVLRLRLQNNVCALNPPPPEPGKSNKRRCIWGSPYYALKTCVLTFLSPLFCAVVPSVFCLSSSCFSKWYSLGFADTFCIIVASLIRGFFPPGMQERTVTSEWLCLICIWPALSGPEDACVGTRITAAWKQFWKSACDLVSVCPGFLTSKSRRRKSHIFE